jgi:hypothetical protein
MANEITIRLGLTAAKGSLALPTTPRTPQLDMTGDYGGYNLQALAATTVEALTVPPDVTGDVHVMLYNASLTAGDTVQVGYTSGAYSSGNYPFVIPKGSGMLFKLRSGFTLYLYASAALNIEATFVQA